MVGAAPFTKQTRNDVEKKISDQYYQDYHPAMAILYLLFYHLLVFLLLYTTFFMFLTGLQYYSYAIYGKLHKLLYLQQGEERIRIR